MKVEEFYKEFTDKNNDNTDKSTRELLYQMMEEYADHKQCNIHTVMKQRELLIAYGEKLEIRSLYLEGVTLDKFTDDFISNL